MKKFTLFYLLSSLIFFNSCSADEENTNPSQDEDWVEVKFDLTGVLDTSEKPMESRSVENPQTYYHIKILRGSDQDYRYLGYVGFFSDLQYARIRLDRNHNYTVYATALIENDFKLNLQEWSIINHVGGDGKKEYNVHNNFSDYMEKGLSVINNGNVLSCPEFTDEGIDRYYNFKNIKVTSNETVCINLKRKSYKINCEIDAPLEGYVELSCEKPQFKFKVGTNDHHLSTSKIYSFGGMDFTDNSKVISCKLEHFDAQGNSTNSTIREITVKNNVETTIKVDYDKFNSFNSFKISLDTIPMTKEEFVWK